MRLPIALSSLFVWAACVGGNAGAYDGKYGVPYDGGADAGTASPARAPTVLTAGLVQPIGIAVIGTTVYAADEQLGDIVALPMGGGAPSTLASGLGGPTWLATDGNQLFVSDTSGGRLLGVTTDGQVTPLATGQQVPGRILVAGGIAYWIDQGASDGMGSILSIPTAGGAPKTLVSGLHVPHDLVIANDEIFFTEVGPSPLCATGANWQQVQAESRIATLPLGGGTPTTFAQQPPPFVEVQGGYLTPTGAGQARGLAVDPTGQWLFFTTRDICWPSAGQIYQTSTTPSATLTTLSVGPPSSDRIDASATDVTWASEQLISQIAFGTPDAVYLNIASQTVAGDFVWNGGTLYWTDQEAGEVLSLTP